MQNPNRPLPPLDLVRGFEAAARRLSFTLAAEELFALERAEEMFGAQNPAEDSEHIRAKQEDIDAGIAGAQ